MTIDSITYDPIRASIYESIDNFQNEVAVARQFFQMTFSPAYPFEPHTRKAGDAGQICPISREPLNEIDTLVKTTCCNTIFGKESLLRWFSTNDTPICAHCRQNVDIGSLFFLSPISKTKKLLYKTKLPVLTYNFFLNIFDYTTSYFEIWTKERNVLVHNIESIFRIRDRISNPIIIGFENRMFGIENCFNGICQVTHGVLNIGRKFSFPNLFPNKLSNIATNIFEYIKKHAQEGYNKDSITYLSNKLKSDIEETKIKIKRQETINFFLKISLITMPVFSFLITRYFTKQ